jgi:hypothetical protein
MIIDPSTNAVVAGAAPTGLPDMSLAEAERWIRNPASRGRRLGNG